MRLFTLLEIVNEGYKEAGDVKVVASSETPYLRRTGGERKNLFIKR